MSPAPTKPKPRLASLDVLRGIAILLVFGRHHPLDAKASIALWKWPGLIWLRYGWTGVDLFFVLSGFLVGGLLMRELRETGSLRKGKFLLRRGLKIWPGYYVYLAALPFIAVQEGLPPGQIGHYIRQRLGPCLANVQNYYYRSIPRFHLWSLAVEEHFYLLLVFLLWALAGSSSPKSSSPKSSSLRRPSLSALPWVVAFIVCCCTLMRAQAEMAHRESLFVTYATHLRMDSLAFGVLLAYLYHFRGDLWERLCRRQWLLLAGAAILVALGGGLPLNSLSRIAGFPMLYLGYGMALIAVVSAPPASPAARFIESAPGRLLAAIGVYSYSIYLWQEDSGARLARALKAAWHLPVLWEWPVLTLAYLAAGILFGIAMARLVEWPALALRERVLPSRFVSLPGAADPNAQRPRTPYPDRRTSATST